MEKSYKETLIESLILTESIPWRSGKIKLEIGKTSLHGLRHDCLVLNNLSYLFELKPSFMFIMADSSLLKEPEGATNGWIIIAKVAQDLEYTKVESGTSYAKTYFFGRQKPERTFDLWFRIFERGFSLSDFEGFSYLDKSSMIEITTKKEVYSKSTFIAGNKIPRDEDQKIIELPARIRRTS